MFEDILNKILGSDIVKNLNENETVKKVKEAIGDNDYVKKLQEGLTGGNLLDKIKAGAQTAGKEGTRLALQLYHVLQAETTPMVDKVIIGAALAYQFMPNLMDKDSFGPILSLLDNAITLAIAYNRVKAHVTPEIDTKVNEQLAEWFHDEKKDDPTDSPVAEETPAETTPSAEIPQAPEENPVG